MDKRYYKEKNIITFNRVLSLVFSLPKRLQDKANCSITTKRLSKQKRLSKLTAARV